MVEMMFILIAVSCFAEYKLVTSWDWLYKVMSNDTIKLPLIRKEMPTKMVPLAFSMCLSMLLGMMFGAAGLIVFVGGLASTACMQPVYAMMRNGTWNRAGGLFQARKAKAVASFEHNKNNIVAAYKGVCRVIAVPVMIIKIVVGIIAGIFVFIGDPKATMRKVFATK